MNENLLNRFEDNKRFYHDDMYKPRNLANLNRLYMANKEQDEEILIRETQAALKSLSGSWNELEHSMQIKRTNDTDESATFPNLFDEKNGTKKMPPISTSTLNYYYSNVDSSYNKIKSNKKLRLSDSKYQSYDFNELVDDDDNTTTNECDKVSSQPQQREIKCESVVYENPSEYRMSAPFSQNSAFRPPSMNDNNNQNKRINSHSSMPFPSAYHFTESNSYSNYSHDTMNTMNMSTEREKPYSRDDDVNASDSKEYTTLQPVKVGSKAESVIQDVVRDGVVCSAPVVSSSNDTTIDTTISMPSNERTFFESPMAAFSPGSTNKGKKKLKIYDGNAVCRKCEIPFECLIDSITLCAYAISLDLNETNI